jgi:hypothetical protein
MFVREFFSHSARAANELEIRMKNLLLMSVASILFVGCAPSVHRTVGMKISERIAHVSLGENEVKPGDEITLYRNICSELTSKDPRRSNCERTKIGKGVITELLNNHYSVAKFPEDVFFREGDLVETK